MLHLVERLSVPCPPICAQAARPSAIIDVIRSAERFRFTRSSDQKLPQPRLCERCGYISSQPVCKACVMLEGLEAGRPGASRVRPSVQAAASVGAGGSCPAAPPGEEGAVVGAAGGLRPAEAQARLAVAQAGAGGRQPVSIGYDGG